MPNDRPRRRTGDIDDPGSYGWRLAALEDQVADLSHDTSWERLDMRYLNHERAKRDYIPREELAAAGDRRARTLNLLLAIAVAVEPIVLLLVGAHS
jgi:hypothetical protein